MRINVINPGYGYTNATVSVNGGGTGAIARAIISPKGGHGKDAISELYANTISLVGRLALEKNKGVEASNGFRQITILKNPKEYVNDTYYRNATASSCALFVCDVTSDNSTAYANFAVDDILYVGQNHTYTLVEKALIADKYYLVVQVNDNYIPQAGSNVYKIDGTNTYLMSITTVEKPDVDKFSGEMLYIDNRTKFTSSIDQAIVASTLISF